MSLSLGEDVVNMLYGKHITPPFEPQYNPSEPNLSLMNQKITLIYENITLMNQSL
jgi:hypothetical protein